MRIDEIDKNFSANNVQIDGEKAIYTMPCAGFDLYGVQYSEEEKRFLRVPNAVAKTVNDGVERLADNTSGGRIRFCTDSDFFELKVEYDLYNALPCMTLLASTGFSLLEETENGEYKRVGIIHPLPWLKAQEENGYTRSFALEGGKIRNYILYFPLYNKVTGLKISLKADAKIGKANKYRDIPPILYYGSSITQGACASRPDNCYQGYISKWTHTDFINLGFSGSARAEDSIVDYMTGIDCSLFVCDYDFNSPSEEHLASTHYRLYERYRAVRKNTPILFISRPSFYGSQSDINRRTIIKETYDKAKRDGDNNVYFLDGETLFGKEDRDNCTVDGCHPNDLGFYRMAKGIYAVIKVIDENFKEVSYD